MKLSKLTCSPDYDIHDEHVSVSSVSKNTCVTDGDWNQAHPKSWLRKPRKRDGLNLIPSSKKIQPNLPFSLPADHLTISREISNSQTVSFETIEQRARRQSIQDSRQNHQHEQDRRQFQRPFGDGVVSSQATRAPRPSSRRLTTSMTPF